MPPPISVLGLSPRGSQRTSPKRPAGTRGDLPLLLPAAGRDLIERVGAVFDAKGRQRREHLAVEPAVLGGLVAVHEPEECPADGALGEEMHGLDAVAAVRDALGLEDPSKDVGVERLGAGDVVDGDLEPAHLAQLGALDGGVVRHRV